MIEHVGEFIDPHGITHIDPVFLIRSASVNSSDHTHMSYDFDNASYSTHPGSHCQITYEVAYWISKAARDEGKSALVYTYSQQKTSISFQTDSVVDLIPQCEAHFTQNYL